MKCKIGFTLLLGFLIFLTVAAVNTDRFSWDLSLTTWIQSLDIGKLEYLSQFNNRMGVVGMAGAVGLAVIIWLWFSGHRAESVSVLLVGAFDLMNPFIRGFIGRPRPDPSLITVYRTPDDFSFPSGTSMHVLMFCGILIYLIFYLMQPGYLRSAIQFILASYILLMGIWLIDRGVHWPSDVLGGYVYGGFFLAITIWCYRKYTIWRRRYPREYVPAQNLPALIRPMARIVNLIS